MKFYILPTLIAIIEIVVFAIFVTAENNLKIKDFFQKLKNNFLEKTKLNLDLEINSESFSKKNYIIFIAILILTLLLDNKMVLIILVTALMLLLLKLRMSYEKFQEVFVNYKPSLKKYNVYLLSILLIQGLTITLTILLAN